MSNNKSMVEQGSFPAVEMAANIWIGQNVKTTMTISTRPPWSDNREAQTNKTTSGIGGDEPLDDDRSVSSPGPISSPESRSSPVVTNRTSLCLQWWQVYNHCLEVNFC